ncbi:MAG: hypothetical protein D6722_03520 [Bacteroidetes bacterium]|nr:MAG: hypothetical protein D6722_03520 [Bacteroidota bacterium]
MPGPKIGGNYSFEAALVIGDHREDIAQMITQLISDMPAGEGLHAGGGGQGGVVDAGVAVAEEAAGGGVVGRGLEGPRGEDVPGLAGTN